MQYSMGELPEVRFTRLNEHYEFAIGLAQLILRCFSIELQHGQRPGVGFLVDMNEVFERFVHSALREALQLSESNFPRGIAMLRLDESNNIVLKPDISWWIGKRCAFVGDVKYKRLESRGFKHADLYQLLAYTIASDLQNGLLIYAHGESEVGTFNVVHANKELHVTCLDVSGTPDQILCEIKAVAEMIRAMVEKVAC